MQPQQSESIRLVYFPIERQMIQPSTRRMRAAEACRLRFQGKSYKPGARDCPLLALHALRKVGVLPWARGLKWRDEADGLRVLKSLGFRSLIEAVDSLGLPRIPPAMALAGDLVALPTTHVSAAVSMGNGNLLAFTDHPPNAEVLDRRVYYFILLRN